MEKRAKSSETARWYYVFTIILRQPLENRVVRMDKDESEENGRIRRESPCEIGVGRGDGKTLGEHFC